LGILLATMANEKICLLIASTDAHVRIGVFRAFRTSSSALMTFELLDL